jgi:hypothetical protein
MASDGVGRFPSFSPAGRACSVSSGSAAKTPPLQVSCLGGHAGHDRSQARFAHHCKRLTTPALPTFTLQAMTSAAKVGILPAHLTKFRIRFTAGSPASHSSGLPSTCGCNPGVDHDEAHGLEARSAESEIRQNRRNPCTCPFGEGGGRAAGCSLRRCEEIGRLPVRALGGMANSALAEERNGWSDRERPTGGGAGRE